MKVKRKETQRGIGMTTESVVIAASVIAVVAIVIGLLTLAVSKRNRNN